MPYTSNTNIKQHIAKFSRQLKVDIAHPKPRYDLLREYVGQLVRAIVRLEKDKEKPQRVIQRLENKLPDASETASATLKDFNHGLIEGFKASDDPVKWCNQVALYLQVEVVKVSRELEKLDDSDIHFITQGQAMEEATDEGEEGKEEHLETLHFIEEMAQLQESPEAVQRWTKFLQRHTPVGPKPDTVEKKEAVPIKEIIKDAIPPRKKPDRSPGNTAPDNSLSR